MGWRVSAGRVVEQVKKGDNGAFLSWIAACSLSFLFSWSYTFPLLASSSLSLLWNPTAVLIPRILLQGLISFPFLERLFKYCYIHSQQQYSLPPCAVHHQAEGGKVLFILSAFLCFCSFAYCLRLCLATMSWSLYILPTLFTLWFSVRACVCNCPLSMLVTLHVRVFGRALQFYFIFLILLLHVTVYMNAERV